MTIKLIPSEAGGSMLTQRGTRLRRIRLAGGRDALGLVLASYAPETIDRLVARGYVTLLEVESADLLRNRSEIRELSSTLGTSAVDAAFERDMRREVERQSADRRRPVDPGSDEVKPLGTMRRIVSAVRNERPSTVEGAARLVRSLGSDLTREIDWLVRNDPSGLVLQGFRDVLVAHGRRLEIPDYLGLVILELVSNLQFQTMQTFAERTGMSEERIRSLYQNTEVRNRIAGLMEQHGETSAISWSVVHHEGKGSRTTELLVTMTGKGAPMRALSTEVKEKRRVDVGTRSIEEFYSSVADSVFNIDLGLYYLSYLEELCMKAGMRLSTRVRETSGGDAMLVLVRIDL